LETKE